jgi:hypothetical protein
MRATSAAPPSIASAGRGSVDKKNLKPRPLQCLSVTPFLDPDEDRAYLEEARF